MGGGAAWAWLNFTAPGPLTASKVVQLPSGTRSDIAVALKDQGVISNASIFSAAAAANELRHARVKVGEYEFPAGATMQDVLSMITRGQFVTYKVTIPEGWTSQMVVDRLNEQDMLGGTIDQVPAEGTLLPETYIVTRGYPRTKLLADMAAAQTKYIDQAWNKLPPDSPVKSKQDLVTLASIVEKETGVASERPMVAAVFVNRLKQHMRLQSDPTVIYGIAGGAGKLDHSLTRDELDAPTPYNTYTNDGLPSGPITNPGKASIDAVLAPATNGYLYFVANGTGGHAFAATLDEHNANVKKWRSLTDAQTNVTAQPIPAPTGTAPAGANSTAANTEAAATPQPATAAPGSTPAPKPGSVVTVDGKQVPIPPSKSKKKKKKP